MKAEFAGDCGGRLGAKELSIVQASEECDHDRSIDPDDAMYTERVDREDTLSQTQYCPSGWGDRSGDPDRRKNSVKE